MNVAPRLASASDVFAFGQLLGYILLKFARKSCIWGPGPKLDRTSAKRPNRAFRHLVAAARTGAKSRNAARLFKMFQDGSENPASRRTLTAVCLDMIQIGTMKF